jgi:DNA-binding GntR family transcriptional regulator
MWSSNLPHHPTQPHVADEHKAIFEAALARDAELAVDLMTQYLRPRRVTSRQSPPPPARRPTRWLADVAMNGNGHLR